MKYRANPRGFTLIEVMVVVLILVILSTMVMIAVYNARKGARDNARVNTAEQLKLGIRLYKEANGAYPAYNDGVEIGVGGAIDTALTPYLPEINKDPLEDRDAATYGYWYFSEYDCGGVKRNVIMVKHLEVESKGNYDTVCGSTPMRDEDESEGLFAHLFPRAHALYGQGSYYGQSAYYTQGTYYTQGAYYAQNIYYTQSVYYTQAGYYSQTTYYLQGLYYAQGSYYTQASYYSQGSYYVQSNYYTQASYYTQGSYYTQASYYTQGAYAWIDGMNATDRSSVYIIFVD